MLQVKNKFKIGDRVFLLNDKQHRVASRITGIHANVFDTSEEIRVSYSLAKMYDTKSESELYASEEEMKNEIFNKPLLEFV
jgi:hypothetical protein